MKRKHRTNLELMETKFNTENALLNDEFLFLTQELEKLQGLAVRREKDHSAALQETQNQKENASLNKLAADLDSRVKKVEQDIRAEVD